MLAHLDQISVVGMQDQNELHLIVEDVDATQVPIVPMQMSSTTRSNIGVYLKT